MPLLFTTVPRPRLLPPAWRFFRERLFGAPRGSQWRPVRTRCPSFSVASSSKCAPQ